MNLVLICSITSVPVWKREYGFLVDKADELAIDNTYILQDARPVILQSLPTAFVDATPRTSQQRRELRTVWRQFTDLHAYIEDRTPRDEHQLLRFTTTRA
jgi:hypothetical protein